MKITAKCPGQSSTRRKSGSIIVVVAMGFVAVCGFGAFATDYGQLVWTRNQLQRACDSAAISGAGVLPDGPTSQTVATSVAAQNRVPSPSIAWPDGVKKIQVSASQEVPFGFAKVIGLRSGNVAATAVAQRMVIKGVGMNVPLAITTTDYFQYRDGTSFEVLLIDNNRQDFVPTKVTALDLRPENSSKSGPIFEADVSNGYPGTITIGDNINALNAALNSQGPNVVQALRDRITRAAGSPYFDTGDNYTFPNYPDNDPRIVTLIVAPPNPLSNNNPVLNVNRLIAVYIESVRKQGNNDYYVQMRIMPSKIFSAEDPGVVIGDDTTPDSGLAVVRLVS